MGDVMHASCSSDNPAAAKALRMKQRQQKPHRVLTGHENQPRQELKNLKPSWWSPLRLGHWRELCRESLFLTLLPAPKQLKISFLNLSIKPYSSLRPTGPNFAYTWPIKAITSCNNQVQRPRQQSQLDSGSYRLLHIR